MTIPSAMLDDDDEEDVIYLEKTLRSGVSVIDKDYMATDTVRMHQDAPKFRRSDHDGSGRNCSGAGSTKRARKNKLSPEMSMINRVVVPCDDDDNDDGDLRPGMIPHCDSCSTADNFDFTNYKTKRQLNELSFPKNMNMPSLDNLSRKNMSTGSGNSSNASVLMTASKAHQGQTGRLRMSVEEEEEELDRPQHWGRGSSGHSIRRRGKNANGSANSILPPNSARQPLLRRQAHPASTSTVTVSKPFSLAIADKFTQQTKSQTTRSKGKQGDNKSVMQLSFQPSWLPGNASNRGAGQVKKRPPVEEEDRISSQEDDDEEEEGGEVAQPPSQPVDHSTSFDPSFRPHHSASTGSPCSHVNLVVIPHFPSSVSVSDSPYASDQELVRDQHHQQTAKRVKRSGSKQPHEHDLLPKLLRMKRLQAELEVRFQNTRTAKGEGVKQHFRSGDLQDPRSRTKGYVDVQIVQHRDGGGVVSGGSAAGGVVLWEQPPFVVLALTFDDESVAGASAELSTIVLGYFKPETFSKMGVSVTVGQRLRIYDSVLLPALSRPDGGTASRILLCTSLCEAL